MGDDIVALITPRSSNTQQFMAVRKSTLVLGLCLTLFLPAITAEGVFTEIADEVMPEDIPEDSVHAVEDQLAEAKETINEMTASGKTDKDCRKLVTDTKKEVTDNVDQCTKIMDALPKGESCPASGQENVKLATESKTKADKHVVYTKTEVTKAEQTEVHFKSVSFNSLTEGKCSYFYSSTSYTTAKLNYKAAVTAHTKAVGAAETASKSLKLAIEAAAKERQECECKVKSDHESAFAKHSAPNAANQKAWSFACRVECVLDGKTQCTCSAAPKCKRAKLTDAVENAAAKCAAAAKKAAEEAAKKKAAEEAAKKKAAEAAAAERHQKSLSCKCKMVDYRGACR